MEVYLSKNISSDEIKKRLKDLDNFKIPKEIFFSNQNLPKLNNGKIDRKKISQKKIVKYGKLILKIQLMFTIKT